MASSAPFTRTDLAKLVGAGGQFKELRDVKWINPREFHRKALADIEDLGYVVGRGVTERIDIEKEAIGEKTGHVSSWAYGTKDITITGSVQWSPFQVAGMVLLAVGGLFLLLGLQQIAFLLAGLLLAIGGALLFFYKKDETFLMHGVLSIKLLANGEATERTIQRAGSNVTDLFAQLTVAYAFLQQLEIHDWEITNLRLREHIRSLVAKKIKAFPQILTSPGAPASGSAFAAWPLAQAPTAEFLTEEGRKLLQSQSTLVGPDLHHLTEMIGKYNVAIESVTTDRRAATI